MIDLSEMGLFSHIIVFIYDFENCFVAELDEFTNSKYENMMVESLAC